MEAKIDAETDKKHPPLTSPLEETRGENVGLRRALSQRHLVCLRPRTDPPAPQQHTDGQLLDYDRYWWNYRSRILHGNGHWALECRTRRIIDLLCGCRCTTVDSYTISGRDERFHIRFWSVPVYNAA
jgi:hypothetical protein